MRNTETSNYFGEDWLFSRVKPDDGLEVSDSPYLGLISEVGDIDTLLTQDEQSKVYPLFVPRLFVIASGLVDTFRERVTNAIATTNRNDALVVVANVLMNEDEAVDRLYEVANMRNDYEYGQLLDTLRLPGDTVDLPNELFIPRQWISGDPAGVATVAGAIFMYHTVGWLHSQEKGQEA